jgi:hypothetical protein
MNESDSIQMRQKKRRRSAPSRLIAIQICIFFAAVLGAPAQTAQSGRVAEVSQSSRSDRTEKSEDPGSPSPDEPLSPHALDEPYRPITLRQRFRWYVGSTIGPAHLAGGMFLSAFATGLDRPEEYGPHWDGFADRFGMRIGCGAMGNAMEASTGLLLGEDPRYFRAPGRTLESRAGNIVRFTFLARRDTGSIGPAYARYTATLGNNFLSNTWRVHSEANTQEALLRTAEGFAARMVANAWDEFWPDIKKRVLHMRN